MISIKTLLKQQLEAGTVDWIGIRPARDAPLILLAEIEITCAKGVVGDRYSGRPGGTRQVTLIQAEHLPVIAQLLNRQELMPDLLRRNILVSGVNLLALINRNFSLGTAVLRGTGRCHPCSKMEKALGEGGYNAMRGHGGITASVVTDGVVKLGDAVQVLAD